MKNLLGYIGCILLLAATFSSILKFTSRDYLTTFTSETNPADVPSPPSSESPTSSTVRFVENPDGSKTYFVDVSVTVTWTAKLSGQFFDSSKYETFVITTIVQEKTFDLLDLLNDISDRYAKWIILLVALFSIPIALPLTIRKEPFSQDSRSISEKWWIHSFVVNI